MSSKDDYLKDGPVFEINPAEIDKNKNGLKSDNTDLKRTTKKTLKDYLSDKSSINQFPVDRNHDENKPDISIYGDSEGKKSPDLNLNSNDPQFKPQFLQKSQSQQIQNFKPGKLLDQNDSNQFNGHNLINQETGKPREELSNYNQNLLKNNRFSGESSYGSNIGNKTFSIKKYMKKSLEENNTVLKIDQNFKEEKQPINLTVEQMNEIASYLMLRASGKSGKPGSGEMFIPGIQQLAPGIKISGRDLNVQELVKDIFVNDLNDKELMGNQLGQSRDSFGVLNNYFDRFEKTSVGTLALSAAIVGATMVSLLAAVAPFSLIITNRPEDLDFNKEKFIQDNKKHAGGTFDNNQKSYSKKEKPSDINPVFEYITGIERSRYINDNRTYFVDFYKEILTGGQIFFSLNKNALALLGSFGYYVNFCRSIVRDTLRIVDLFTPKNGESTIEFTDNIVSYDTLQIVKNSKLIKTINLFIKLSDIEKSINNNETNFINDNKNLSTDVTNFKRQSVNYNHLKLKNLVIDNNVINHLVTDNSKFNVIKDEKRSDLQEEYILNSDLLPFYFKDLRTNKIVSFYATIGDFSENYSPQWQEEHFYGRIDPIKFYKSTTRKISLSFKVFSSGNDDYKVMWDKLQDLVSLIYPKYTDYEQRKKVTIKDKTVYVPYSQSFNQQPLIRVKVGELITNNISSELNANFDQFIEYGDKQIPEIYDLTNLTDSEKTKGMNNDKLQNRINERFKQIVIYITNNNSYSTSSPNQLKNPDLLEELNKNIKWIKYDNKELNKIEIIRENISDKPKFKINYKETQNPENVENLSKLTINYTQNIDQEFKNAMQENVFYKAMKKAHGLGALAYIDSLSYKTQEGYSWELDDESGRRPKIIDVSMEMTILHDIQPFSKENYKHYQELPSYNSKKIKLK